MKYVGVTLITPRGNVGKIYWFKFYEDELGPLDDVKVGQLVLVDTGRGFQLGRIVKRSSGMNKKDVTQQVISLVRARDTIVGDPGRR